MVHLTYAILALLGISVLIFVHELGHYFMARYVGMRVETFSIGFGKPIVCWERQGVKWQIGWLPFGGFVKIAGMDTSEEQDVYQIPDGFFGKSPFSRIQVAFMGPFVNFLFALGLFSVLWLGGRTRKKLHRLHSKNWMGGSSLRALYSRYPPWR